MCKFKKKSDDDSDDEEMVEGVIFHNINVSDNESDSESDFENNLGEEEEEEEPRAGPSSARDDDPEWEPSSDSSDDESDELIRAFSRAAKASRQKHPPDINFRYPVIDLSCHPGDDFVAIASVTGDIYVYEFSIERCDLMDTIEAHSKPCRNVEYSWDGDYIISTGKDKSIMITDSTTNTLQQFYDNAHESPPFSLFVLSKTTFSTGDEDGTLKVWDVRKKDPVCSFKVGEELISSIISNTAAKYLVCTSGGTLTTYDLGSQKLLVESEPYDQELCSMKLMKRDSKLVVGSDKGTLFIFNWGQFGYHSDIYPGQKDNINATLEISDNILVTGSGDGLIRAVNLFPHKQLGVVGQHQITVENLDMSHDGEYIASIGFEECVKFWDIRYFDTYIAKAEKSKKTDSQHNLPSSKVRNPADFFSELS